MVWMSDVDAAHQTVNVFKIAEDGNKYEFQKKDTMEEATKPHDAMMTDELRKYSTLLSLCTGFFRF